MIHGLTSPRIEMKMTDHSVKILYMYLPMRSTYSPRQPKVVFFRSRSSLHSRLKRFHNLIISNTTIEPISLPLNLLLFKNNPGFSKLPEIIVEGRRSTLIGSHAISKL